MNVHEKCTGGGSSPPTLCTPAVRAGLAAVLRAGTLDLPPDALAAVFIDAYQDALELRG